MMSLRDCMAVLSCRYICRALIGFDPLASVLLFYFYFSSFLNSSRIFDGQFIPVDERISVRSRHLFFFIIFFSKLMVPYCFFAAGIKINSLCIRFSLPGCLAGRS